MFHNTTISGSRFLATLKLRVSETSQSPLASPGPAARLKRKPMDTDTSIEQHAQAIREWALPQIKAMSERIGGRHANLEMAIWADGRMHWTAYTETYGHSSFFCKTAAEAIFSAAIQDSPSDLAAQATTLEAQAAALRALANRQSPIANPQSA